jgi:hypothetical protein
MARKTSGSATASETKDKCFRPEAMVDGKKVWGCQGVVDEMLNGNNSHELKALLARSVSPPLFEDSSEGASSQNADSGGGASSASDMAPPSRTAPTPTPTPGCEWDELSWEKLVVRVQDGVATRPSSS